MTTGFDARSVVAAVFCSDTISFAPAYEPYLRIRTAVILNAAVVHADELVRHRGRCQSLTTLDRPASLQCRDEMIEQSSSGERGFVFHGSESAVFFVVTDRSQDIYGTRVLPIARVDFGFKSEVEQIDVLSGECRSEDPARFWRATTTCDAVTNKGRFTAQFVTIDGATDRLKSTTAPR